MCVVSARGRTARERRDVGAAGWIVRSARAQAEGPTGRNRAALSPRAHHHYNVYHNRT